MFFSIAFHDNLTLILWFFSVLDHDSFLIFTTLINELSNVKLTCANQSLISILVFIATIVDWKFYVVLNPAHTFIIKALFELLIEWLFYVEDTLWFLGF